MKKFPLLALMLAAVLTLQAQKVKYKDIFPDLEARKFNKVEPLLKSFLANEKNAEHPNANYQMGLITEAHFLLQDVVTDTVALFKFGEEALAYYRKSITLITEKELKKNNEFYQAFNRRDLRSGEFGIKLSDVHLEIEKKIESIENRIAAVKSFGATVQELTAMESKMLVAYNSFVSSSESYNDFLLKADLDQISKLGDLQASFRAFDDKANATLKIGEVLGAGDYYNSLEYLPINNFIALKAKFPESNSVIRTWDFSDWASDIKVTLNRDVFPMKNELKAFDQKLLQVTNALRAGTSSITPQSIPPNIDETLGRYDARPLPRDLLKARINENTIRYLTDTTMNTMLLDSSVIAYQVDIADSILNAMKLLNELLELDPISVKKAMDYYPEYLSTYGGAEGLQKYAKTTKSWLRSIEDYWQENKAFWFMRDNWGVTSTDTIPLHVVDTSYHGSYVTKGYLDLPDNEIVSWGFKRDSLIGFVARFGADRTLVWEDRFDTELLYVDPNFEFETDTLSADEGQLAFYLYKEMVPGEANINVVNVDLAGELNWSVNTQTSRKPEYTTYSHSIQETTIFLYPQEMYPLTNGELGYLIISRDGEIR